MDIDAGGQSMQAQGSSDMTLDATFASAADGVEISIEVRDFAASQSNPMTSASSNGEGIDGLLVMHLDRTGRATAVSEPTVTGDDLQFFQPSSLTYGFFPRLPGRAAAVRDMWTDTVSYEATQADSQITVNSVLDYTLAGDTLVNGARLVRITMEGTIEQVADGQITGMDFSQELSGAVSGWVLWDLQRRLMIESFSEGDLRGSMDVAAAPFPLGVRVRQQNHVQIQEGN
jgi:hypothetical protein